MSVLVDFTSGLPVQAEAIKYFSYGTPVGLPPGDANSDGQTQGGDATQMVVQAWSSNYDVRGDLDLDVDVDGTDLAAVAALSGTIGIRRRCHF